jgi:hypothetical protein
VAAEWDLVEAADQVDPVAEEMVAHQPQIKLLTLEQMV